MNNINFHSLKNISVPDGLQEKVLAIPERSDERAPAPIARTFRLAAAAAGFVIIAAVSMVFFLHTGDQPPVVVQSSPTAYTESPTEDSNGYPDKVRPTTAETVSATAASPNKPKTDGIAAPLQKGTDQPNRPSIVPTEHSMTESGDTLPASQPATVADDPPTERPAETRAPWNPQPPTALPWSPPTEEPWRAPVAVSVTIPRAIHPSDGKVYCRIETPDGTLLGGFGLFDDERLMTNLGSSGGYIYYYRFAKYYDVPFRSPSDTYNCVVYDSAGNVLSTKVNWS